MKRQESQFPVNSDRHETYAHRGVNLYPRKVFFHGRSFPAFNPSKTYEYGLFEELLPPVRSLPSVPMATSMKNDRTEENLVSRIEFENKFDARENFLDNMDLERYCFPLF